MQLQRTHRAVEEIDKNAERAVLPRIKRCTPSPGHALYRLLNADPRTKPTPSAAPARSVTVHPLRSRVALGFEPRTAVRCVQMANEFREGSSHSAEYFGDSRDHWWNPDYLQLLAARWGL